MTTKSSQELFSETFCSPAVKHNPGQLHHAAFKNGVSASADIVKFVLDCPCPEHQPPIKAPVPEPQPEPEPLLFGPFPVDDSGYAVSYPGGHHIPSRDKDLRQQIKKIADHFGLPYLGRGRTVMTKADKQNWLQAWYSGDLQTCYELEAAHAKAHLAHPGHPDTTTRHIVWTPAVKGEVPAGIWLAGDWPSPQGTWNGPELNNYLISAKMAHPEHLSSLDRRRWVLAHVRGDKVTVDRLSLQAKKNADANIWTWTHKPQWSDLAAQPSYAEFIEAGASADKWAIRALRTYAKAHHISLRITWTRMVTLVDAAVYAQQQIDLAAAAVLAFTLDPDQPTLSGFHRKHVLLDQHSRRWLFKPVPHDAAKFRPETEHEAHVLARAWGYRAADSRLIEHDGAYGQAQAMLPVAHNLAGYSGEDFNSLTLDQLIALAREHLLDWAIDNDDSHGENIVILDDATLVGIDKGRAWRYFGGWDGLSATGSANSNAPLVYTELYTAIRKHILDQDTVDTIYREVIAQARRMQYLPDIRLAEIIGRAVANRPHYKPSTYQKPIAQAPTNADELIAAATARKNQLVADMQILWQRVYDGAGWTLPELTASPLGYNAQGHILHAGLLSPELHGAVMATKSYGTACFVAGTAIEDAHILLWRERRADGHFNIRGHCKVRGETFDKMRAWCKMRAWTVGAQPKPAPAPSLSNEPGFYEVIIQAAKTISYHHEDKQYNQAKLVILADIITSLQYTLNYSQEKLHLDADDEYGTYAATVDMASQYLAYITVIHQHKANGTKSKDGDFPRYVFTPKTSLSLPPTPELRVERRPACRAAAHMQDSVKLGPDGELDLCGGQLQNYTEQQGQIGAMYLITLPNGDQIEFRGSDDTDTPYALQGQLQFTITNADALTAGLTGIIEQLTTMGMTITDATPTDLELFYWRHLAGILDNRADSRSSQPAGPYALFWQRVNNDVRDTDAEISMWRSAFAALASPQHIDAFLAADGHLPRFLRLDTRNPDMPCGKPYWERFDVAPIMWRTQPMPSLRYKSGPGWVVQAGACMSTEARIRCLGIWKCGLSSADDMYHGSSAFIFTRQNQEDGYDAPNVYFNPRVLIRTSNYAFASDTFGKQNERINRARFTFGSMTNHYDSTNELMVKDSLSLLDDIEILIFGSATKRSKAIALLAERGITEIRGVPVETRLILAGNNVAKAAAINAAKKTYQSE